MAITEAETLGQQSSFKYKSIKKKKPLLFYGKYTYKTCICYNVGKIDFKNDPKTFWNIEKSWN